AAHRSWRRIAKADHARFCETARLASLSLLATYAHWRVPFRKSSREHARRLQPRCCDRSWSIPSWTIFNASWGFVRRFTFVFLWLFVFSLPSEGAVFFGPLGTISRLIGLGAAL